MTDECIHGFADGLCATCNPKPLPAPTAASRPAARSRASTRPRALARDRPAPARTQAGPAPADALLEQRIYHLTHLSNLAGIVAAGAIVAGADPQLALSTADLREERAGIVIPGAAEAQLTDFVAFFLAPEAGLWQSLRSGREHPRLSSAALRADPLEFVFLVSTVRHILSTDSGFALADGTVEAGATRFATTREDAERMLSRLRADPDGAHLANGELLAEGRVPLEVITLIGVANDKVRTAVRDVLASSGFAPKIAVYPPWFQSAD